MGHNLQHLSGPAPSTQRRHDHATTGRSVRLATDHGAVVERRTLFPSRVRYAEETKHLLVGGHNSRKIGKRITKGEWKGFPIFTLTLQERATCPSSCRHWLTCYGNNMHMAIRVHHDAEFEEILWLELEALQQAHPDGYAVRLHVLGDFYSVGYVELWERALKAFPALHVWGYTARELEDPIGKRLYTLATAQFDRFALRFSGQDWKQLGAPTVAKGEKHAVAITCPAQTSKTECCATCTLCWSTKRSVAFEQHGKTEGRNMAFAKIDNPKASSASDLGPNHVRVVVAKAKGNLPYIRIRIGREVARLCSLTQPEHKVHAHIGSGSDAGKVAISLDDTGGVFKAKRQRAGDYTMTIGGNAAHAAGISTEFEPFRTAGLARQIENGPRMCVFEAPPAFLGYQAKAA